jgi:hypothetical protein
MKNVIILIYLLQSCFVSLSQTKKKQIIILNSRIDSLYKAIEGCEISKNNLNNKLLTKEEDISHLKNELLKIKSELELLKGSNIENKIKIEKLEKENQSLKTKIAILEKPCISETNFLDKINSTGLPTNIIGWSLKSSDFDNDGDEDLIYAITSSDNFQFFCNNGNGTFSNVTEKLGLEVPKSNFWIQVFDFNKDGYKDLVHAIHENGTFKLTFLQNVGNLKYKDITYQTECPNRIEGSCSFLFDYENDGDLDIIFSTHKYEKSIKVLTISINTSGLIKVGNIRNLIHFGNELGKEIQPIPTSIADFDNDGDADIVYKKHCMNCGLIGDGNYYSHEHGLLINEGKGKFKEATNSSGLGSMPGADLVWDYNNDGNFDIYSGTPDNLSNYSGSKIRIWEGRGNGKFIERTDELKCFDNTTNYLSPWPIDFDNDGDLDLYSRVAGYGDTKNRLYENNGGKTPFIETSSTYNLNIGTGFDHNAGVLALDYDLDGDKDLFMIENNSLILLKNNLSCNNWIKLILNGCQSNTDGLGIKIIIKIKDRKYALAKDGFSSELLIGLGDITIIDSISVFWTNSSIKVYNNVQANQIFNINEDEQCLSK